MALFVASFLVLFVETALIRWMPAYIRLPARDTPPQPDRLVPAGPARRDPGGRSPAAGSGGAGRVDDLLLERDGRSRRSRGEHAAAAAALHIGRRAVRHRRASHGPRADGPSAAPRLRDQPAGKPG